MARELDATTFDEAIKSAKPVLVDFYATWCNPCMQQAPILERWAAAKGEAVEVTKVNVDNSPELASRFGVMSIPTLIIFNGGAERGRAIGLQNERGLDALLAKASK